MPTAMVQTPRGGSTTTPSGRPTFTTRAIGLSLHCLRHNRWVRQLAATAEWLRHGADAERDLLAQLDGWDRRLLSLLRLPPFRALFLRAVDHLAPGTTRHLLCRKIWFFEQASTFLATEGHAQVVILGAGLDPLGLRLCRRFATARVVEVDRPAAIAAKRSALAGVENLRFLTTNDAPIADLGALGCDPDQPTLVLAEGLLMYLQPTSVAQLLEGLAASTRAPLRFAFSCLDDRDLADPTSPIAGLERRLARRRPPERFEWSTTTDDLTDFLATRRFALQESLGADELAARILGDDAGRSYGEFVAIATTHA